MNSYQIATTFVAIVAALAAVPFVRYVIRCPDSPWRRPILIGGLRLTLLSVILLVIVFLSPYDVQALKVGWLPLLLTSIPVDAALASMSGRVANTYASLTRPKVRRVLVVAPYLLAATWLLKLVICSLFPSSTTTLDYDVRQPPGSLPTMFLLYLPELPYMLLMAWLFFQMAGGIAPSKNLRRRNRYYCSVVLGMIAIVFLGLCRQGNLVAGPQSLLSTVSFGIIFTQGLVGLAGIIALFKGITLHYERSRLDLWVESSFKWLILRERIGLALLTAPFSQGARLRPVADAIDRTGLLLAIPKKDRDKAVHIVTLLWCLSLGWTGSLRWLWLTSPTHLRRSDVLWCASLQDFLIKRQHEGGTLRWRITIGKTIVCYDITDDPVHASLRPALLLSDGSHKLSLQNAPDWLQLAAAASAYNELLPHGRADAILAGKSVQRRVVKEYLEARHALDKDVA